MTQPVRVSEERGATEVLGWLYVYFWVKRANFRAILEKSAIGILTLFLLLLMLELAVEVFWHEVFIRGVSIALQILFGVAFGVSLYNKIREWREKKQEYLHIRSSEVIARILSDSREVVAGDGTIERLLAIFHQPFAPRRTVSVTLALLDQDESLRVCHRFPPSNRDGDTRFPPGEGAAGYCTKNRCTVYVPRKRFGHAVLKVETDDGKITYDYASGMYLAQPGDGAYEAVLSVPIVIFGTCYGALSFDSPKPNAFRRLDLAIASSYASLVAQVLQLRRSISSSTETPGHS